MRLVDLSAPITVSPPELPEFLRTDIEYEDHARGAQAVKGLLGVGPELLRDGVYGELAPRQQGPVQRVPCV